MRLRALSKLALVLLVACGVSDADLVAKVNGDGITKKDFEAAVERNMARYKGQSHELPPGIEGRIKESVLRRMIDDKIIEQKGKSLGISVTAEELEAKFKEHKERFRTDEAFNDYLKRSGNTLEAMKEDLQRNLLRDRVVEKMSGAIATGDEEISKYYTENVARYTEKEQVKASRVLIRLAGQASDSDKKAAMKAAKEVRAKLAKPNADFAAIAKEASKGPEASRGGDLGMITRGRMTPDFDNVVFAMQPGQLSDVFETKQGFEIVKVFEKTPERQRPLEEVKESIKTSLEARKRNEKRRDVLRQLKADAKVETLIQFDTVPGSATMPPKVARPGEMPPGMEGRMPPGAMPPGMAPPPGQPGAAPGPGAAAPTAGAEAPDNQ